MKYYLDQEFIEGFHNPLFGKPRHFIDLISIGIVAEDGREYQAISNEYKYDDASDWVKANVIMPLYTSTVHGDQRNSMSESNFHRTFGKPNHKIAEEILLFICEKEEVDYFIGIFGEKRLNAFRSYVEFYGYFADYDWVLFCSLFGSMMQLPTGFPQYCRDLKQTFDERKHAIVSRITAGMYGSDWRDLGPLLDGILKSDPAYPIQHNTHIAIEDARWNKKFDEWLSRYK